ncbi:hypothetical protein [Bacillus tropicus]|uniref:hypothetical protein n=1 Tax=Bacillus tropicus TaxID=2026188 RepID=UPI0021CFFFD3|nr:hypothetical protein [Bacillus tropicus]MCU5223998.1 hypothetical protein [Bacillus tropicus]
MTLTLADLHTMKAGTVLQKGKRKRIFLGIEGMFAYYKTPSSKSITGENLAIFRKWLMNATVVEN